ncbi:hypothetical protein QBC37DRAFT_408066 [Rhypophila decipiens]|uniref:Uncharacterized protein n=1 Tax=Rhypophila decipiens TaxID=261697 RepID=A0AAN7BE98_9PEZI|nr:hypothetical protein QBC37DRAFT_408066 [Rhypophila decipiens]
MKWTIRHHNLKVRSHQRLEKIPDEQISFNPRQHLLPESFFLDSFFLDSSFLDSSFLDSSFLDSSFLDFFRGALKPDTPTVMALRETNLDSLEFVILVGLELLYQPFEGGPIMDGLVLFRMPCINKSVQFQRKVTANYLELHECSWDKPKQRESLAVSRPGGEEVPRGDLKGHEIPEINTPFISSKTAVVKSKDLESVVKW